MQRGLGKKGQREKVKGKSRHDKEPHYVTIPKQSFPLSTLFLPLFLSFPTVYSFSIPSFLLFKGKQKHIIEKKIPRFHFMETSTPSPQSFDMIAQYPFCSSFILLSLFSHFPFDNETFKSLETCIPSWLWYCSSCGGVYT